MPSTLYALPHNDHIHVFVYENVTTPSLKLSLNQAKLPVTLLNGKSIYHIINLCQAATKALQLQRTKDMKTQSIHTEIAYQLASSSHIPAGLEQMEFNQLKHQPVDKPNVLVAIAINATEEQLELVEKILNPSNDQSIIRTVDQLSSMCDLDTIKQSYKIPPVELTITQSNQSQSINPIVAAIAGRISIK